MTPADEQTIAATLKAMDATLQDLIGALALMREHIAQVEHVVLTSRQATGRSPGSPLGTGR